MADHNPPFLFDLDGNKDPEDLFEVGELSQAVKTKDGNYNISVTVLILHD